MNPLLKLILIAAAVFVIGASLLAAGCGLVYYRTGHQSHPVWIAGSPNLVDEGVIDMWRGVPVRYNGVPYTQSWGKHYADDGYYYGQKWQCVEFMKRYYHDRMKHAFPDVMGHAADFFDANTQSGTLNVKRGLWQYVNGHEEAPQVDDILVWTSNGYGHVAIITRVEDGMVQWIQQNVRSGTRGETVVSVCDGKFFVGEYGMLGAPAGWLRAKK
ncbi:MAG: CHAP domain-containing protein [Verrucomicrobiales bacterium]|jgi:surface antigen|nr:CHAP domain-containing protein [Verrucomicrobiales bacterium]